MVGEKENKKEIVERIDSRSAISVFGEEKDVKEFNTSLRELKEKDPKQHQALLEKIGEKFYKDKEHGDIKEYNVQEIKDFVKGQLALEKMEKRFAKDGIDEKETEFLKIAKGLFKDGKFSEEDIAKLKSASRGLNETSVEAARQTIGQLNVPQVNEIGKEQLATTRGGGRGGKE